MVTNLKFLQFLELVTRVYHGPGEAIEAAKQAQPELLATPPPAEAATEGVAVAACGRSSTITNFEVGNFNLDFDLGLDEEEAQEEQDTSADLFE